MVPNREPGSGLGLDRSVREVAPGDPAVGFRFAGISRLGWLIVAMTVLGTSLLWFCRDLPLPAFAASLQPHRC